MELHCYLLCALICGVQTGWNKPNQQDYFFSSEVHPREINSCLNRRFVGRRIPHYSNTTSTFQVEIFSCGDVESNPGPHGGLFEVTAPDPPRPTTSKLLSCTLLNARSLRSKIPELESYICTTKPDIICINETWLTEDIYDASLGFPNEYLVFRRDRADNRRGGGVLLALHRHLKPDRKSIHNDTLELIWATFKNGSDSWLIGVLYRPPNSNASYWELLQAELDSVKPDDYDGLLLLGDLNVDMSPNVLSNNRTHLSSFMNDFDLTQMVASPTRLTATNVYSGSLIDLVLTNRDHAITNVHTMANPVESDHLAVCVRLRSSQPAPMPSVLRSFLHVNKGDFDHLRTLLHLIPWNSFLDPCNVEESSELFLDLFNAAIKESIPQSSKRKSKCSPWITAELKKLISKKHCLFRNAKRTKASTDWVTYKTIRNQVKTLTRKAYWTYVNTLFARKDNRKSFWSFVRSRKQSLPPPKFKYNEAQFTQPDDIAAAFNSHFSSVFSPPSTLPTEAPECTLPISELNRLTVSDTDVSSALSRLPVNKSPGPDGISPNVLSKVASEISHPLSILFNASLSCGKVPSSWRKSHITPVFKNGDRSLVSNYRPVALTSVLCKVLEKLVVNCIQEHVGLYGLMSKHQHGFTKGKNCVTQLVNLVHNWAASLDKPRPPHIDAIFLDMSKAFDRMPHNILLSKLATQYNIRGNIWKWVRSFLSNRLQRVMFLGSLSSWSNVPSGVPQGSVIGPLLFNLFVNNVISDVSSDLFLFADDMLLFRTIRSHDDEMQLQHDLDSLHQWTITNGMSFNPSKTKVMHITRKRNIQNAVYTLGDTLLSSVTSYKYLGIVIGSNLSWNIQVDAITARASRLLGFIRVVARGSSTSAIFALYKALVLPILEYGIPAWHPNTLKQTQQLERIQRIATRVALKQRRGEMPYEERLRVLNWSTLSARRDYLLCSFTFKCLYFCCDCETLIENTAISKRRLFTLSFIHQQSRTQALFLSASRRFPRVWDELPLEVRDASVVSSLSSFLLSMKRSLLDSN